MKIIKVNKLGRLAIIAFSLLTSLALAEDNERPKGDYLFASSYDGRIMKPSIATITEGKSDSSFIEVSFQGRVWKGAINFRLIDTGIVGPDNKESYKYWVFDTVLTIDKARRSLILSGRVGEDGSLAGTSLYHIGLGKFGVNRKPIAAVGTFAMSKKK